ncbi:MAG: diphthine--ammonia ligase [Candidatus Geothermarchaeales archaeon]
MTSTVQIVASWSGGKESCLACYKALLDGFVVSHLLNLISVNGRRCASHGVNPGLMAAQSEAIGIPVVQRRVTWDTWEREFKEAIRGLKQMGVNGAVFGDIDIQDHRDWVERVCSELEIDAVMPLWSRDPEQILTEFIEEGFEAIVVTTKADIMGREWLGRRIDRAFLRDLRRLGEESGVHLCGESGEYHTLVIDGPMFKRRIEILEWEETLREGYWFLNILKYE